MSYDTLERQIRMLPEEYLEDVSRYIEFVIFKLQKSEGTKPVQDMDTYFGVLKNMPDGLELQRRIRDEWD